MCNKKMNWKMMKKKIKAKTQTFMDKSNVESYIRSIDRNVDDKKAQEAPPNKSNEKLVKCTEQQRQAPVNRQINSGSTIQRAFDDSTIQRAVCFI